MLTTGLSAKLQLTSGKMQLKDSKAFKGEIKMLDIQFVSVCTDSWKRFLVAFKEDNWVVGKKHTVGIESNNYRHQFWICFKKHTLQNTTKKFIPFEFTRFLPRFFP
jgi:IS1 family transposase